MLIAQISDPHLRTGGLPYQGVADAVGALSRVVDQLNSMSPSPDFVLLTGDVVDTGLMAEYLEARAILDRLRMPLFFIPGNHDDRDAFRRCFYDHPYIPRQGPISYTLDMDETRLVALDVTVASQPYGRADDQATNWLSKVLAEQVGRPTVVIMHQPPFKVQIPYIDELWCQEGQRIISLVRSYPNVMRVLCGHVHQFIVVGLGNYRMLYGSKRYNIF